MSDEAEHPVYLACGEQGEARGRIIGLNYALHGEVNGYRLDDGTLVHVKPDGAKKYQLHVGDTICARGSLHRGTAAPVLEARSVERWSNSVAGTATSHDTR